MNLLTYLRDHRPELYTEAGWSFSRVTCSSRSQPTLQEVVTQGKASKVTASPQLSRAVTYFIVKDMQSLPAAEKPGFRCLVSTLDPTYKLRMSIF